MNKRNNVVFLYLWGVFCIFYNFLILHAIKNIDTLIYIDLKKEAQLGKDRENLFQAKLQDLINTLGSDVILYYFDLF